tara:strand:+ start:337 stop:474 length:138 start_codon:yes stop_codon:yes gene_type:complete
MTNVIQYLIQLSNEQKAMFQEVTQRVDEIDEKIQRIVETLEDKLD